MTGDEMTARSIDPARTAGALLIEHCDIPVGMTLAEWRRAAARPDASASRRRASGLRRLLARGR